MSKSVNKTLVGAFVSGAVALLLLAMGLFGSGQLFKQTTSYVVIFESSLSGLRKGSPVVFRGVPVGQVGHITLTGDVDDMDFQTPVVIELDEGITDMQLDTDGSKGTEAEADVHMLKLINAGLRARLTPQSFLTGQLMIELDFFPKYETGDYEAKTLTYFDGYPLIPTLPSRIDSLLQTLYKIPAEDIAKNILDITEQLKIALTQANVPGIAADASAMMASLKSSADGVDQVVKDFHSLVISYRRLADDADQNLAGGFAALEKTLATLDAAIKNISATVTSVRGVISPTSLIMVELTRSLREITEAARSVRGLANTLDRNPEALLRGKGGR